MIRAKGLPASAALLALLASIASSPSPRSRRKTPRRSVTLDDMNQIKWPDEPAAVAGRQAGRVRSRGPDLRRPDRRRRAARASRPRARRPRSRTGRATARALYFLSDRAGQEEPALETAADFLRRGDAGHDVRARHRRARISRPTNRGCCCRSRAGRQKRPSRAEQAQRNRRSPSRG